jgi:hypothetical protein
MPILKACPKISFNRVDVMEKDVNYIQNQFVDSVESIVKGLDQDVERGEDVLMFGFCIVMLSTTFAPIIPPHILLPCVALIFAITGGLARLNYHAMERKLKNSVVRLAWHEQRLLVPISEVFAANPMPPLAVSYNPLKDLQRTFKSILGGILINPFWMPIFYMMGIHMKEERNLYFLNRAIIGVEKKISPLE